MGGFLQVQIRTPEADSEDEKVRKKRTCFEGFPLEMGDPLEKGEVSEVDKLLREMDALEAMETAILMGRGEFFT